MATTTHSTLAFPTHETPTHLIVDPYHQVEAYLAAFVQGNHSTLINLDPSQPATDAALAIAAVSGPDGRPASSQPTPTLPSEEQLEWETKALLQQLLALGVDLTDASRQTEQEEVDEEDADDQFNEEIIVHQAVDEAQLFPDKLPDQHQQQRQSSHDSLLPTSSIDPSLSLTSPSSARSPSDASLISQDHDVDPIHTRLASLISPPLTQPQLPTPILGSSLDPPTGTQAESTPSTSSIARLLALKPSSTLPITSNRLSNSSTDSAKQALTKMSMGNKQKKVFSVPGWEAERDQDVESWCCSSPPPP